MLDSTGKIPSGILKGSNFELGAYDECLDISAILQDDAEVKGKYCLSGLVLPYNILLENITDSLLLSRIKRDVPRHFERKFHQLSPRNDLTRYDLGMDFEGLLISVCVPDKCMPSDIFEELGVDAMCETKGQTQELDGGDIACL